MRRTRAASLLAVAAAIAAVVLISSSHGRSHRSVATVSSVAARPHKKTRTAAIPNPPAEVRGAAARRMRIPILMYHVIGTPTPGGPNPDLWVTPADFRAQMAALRKRHYYAITLERAFEALTRGTALPRRPVVVSFDDGYRGDYRFARPVLAALGWPGVLNLELNNVGRGGVTPREVRALIRSGWELDSHTITHPDLTTLDASRLRHELVDSRRMLQRRFGVKSDFFCYPSGRYDSAVVAAVKAAGYRGATTTTDGLATAAELYTEPRIRVHGGEPAGELLASLAADGAGAPAAR